MASVRNRFFLEGILLGGLCGVVLGSLIAFQVGNERVKAARSLVERVVRGEPSVPYVHIRQ